MQVFFLCFLGIRDLAPKVVVHTYVVSYRYIVVKLNEGTSCLMNDLVETRVLLHGKYAIMAADLYWQLGG